MDVSVERLAGNQVEMTITVSPEDVDSAVQKAGLSQSESTCRVSERERSQDGCLS